MKCKTVVDPNREEEVIVYVHQRSKLSDDIEEYVTGYSSELIGYLDKSAVKLNQQDIFCIVVENNKIFALTENEKFRLKQRLYTLEEILIKDFVKINQSCIVNIKKIKKFDASFSGALSLTLKNGYKDYVSRRQLKFVKERIGV